MAEGESRLLARERARTLRQPGESVSIKDSGCASGRAAVSRSRLPATSPSVGVLCQVKLFTDFLDHRSDPLKAVDALLPLKSASICVHLRLASSPAVCPPAQARNGQPMRGVVSQATRAWLQLRATHRPLQGSAGRSASRTRP